MFAFSCSIPIKFYSLDRGWPLRASSSPGGGRVSEPLSVVVSVRRRGLVLPGRVWAVPLLEHVDVSIVDQVTLQKLPESAASSLLADASLSVPRDTFERYYSSPFPMFRSDGVGNLRTVIRHGGGTTLVWRGWLKLVLMIVSLSGLCVLGVAECVIFRRNARFKKGLCVNCAYPVGDSEQCPECGKPYLNYSRWA